jgi:penicillin-binding protein 2
MYLLRQPEDLPPQLRSRLSVRVALLTALVIAVVAVVAFRLWYLQILSGPHYRQLAEENRVREIRVKGPRGRILDRSGRPLVANRAVLTLTTRPSNLPSDPERRASELTALARVLDASPKLLRRRIAEAPRYAGYPVSLWRGLSREQLFYLLENRERFPGMDVEHTFVRRYQHGTLAAHALGIVAEASPGQLEDPRNAALEPGDEIGRSGLEYRYDRFLRGTPGETRIQVDSMGRPRGQLGSTPARGGDDLRLTLDSRLQAVGEAALRERGLPGAFVAMDARSGAVLAIGSYPTYDPAFYTRPHTRAEYRAFEAGADPALLDRAIQGGYPTGSAFKPVTATAALEEGLIEPDTIFNDTGSLDIGGLVLHNAGGAAYGPVDMSDALQVSSDVYFYSLGLEGRASGRHGQIQDWARRLGLGRKPGIDLPAQDPGLIPTPAWRNRVFRERSHPYIDRPWNQGDNVNLAIGQGDLLVTPLQLARAYAAIANGGALVTPHLADRVVDASGRTVEEIEPPPERRLRISGVTRETVLDGMRRAAMEPGGTSYSVFGGSPLEIAGKTGTAERGEGAEDQSWYGAIAPFAEPEIVVTATVERGGFGVESAAPIVARILEQYFGPSASGAAGAPGAQTAGGPE